jgi:CRP-like cAMP-binding protein
VPLPRRLVAPLAESRGALARRLREMALANLHAAQARMVLLGRGSAMERIASFLIEMAGRMVPTTSPHSADAATVCTGGLNFGEVMPELPGPGSNQTGSAHEASTSCLNAISTSRVIGMRVKCGEIVVLILFQ